MDANRFSRWAHWNDRDKLERLKNPGVYALAISNDDISGEQFSWIEQIVYIGMSNAVAGLKGRLKQFDKTIIGKTGHGGAERFLRDYSYEKLVPLLYVAVAPFECEVTSNDPRDLLIMGDVAKAEYECWAQFVTKFKKGLPKYNDKKNAPKFSKLAVAP